MKMISSICIFEKYLCIGIGRVYSSCPRVTHREKELRIKEDKDMSKWRREKRKKEQDKEEITAALFYDNRTCRLFHLFDQCNTMVIRRDIFLPQKAFLLLRIRGKRENLMIRYYLWQNEAIEQIVWTRGIHLSEIISIFNRCILKSE